MKTTVKTLALLGLLSSLGNAAITISGTVGTSFKGADGTTNIPVGSLFLVVADAGTAGFLAASTNGALTAGTTGKTALADPLVAIADASITAGGFFGGDKILATGSITTAGVMPTLLTAVTIAGFEGQRFAVIWFEKSAATLTSEGLGSQAYGILSGADWLLPATDSGLFTMSATDANGASSYYSTSLTLAAAQIGANGFFTGTGTAGDASADVKSATFAIIPEPSTALLGALGALALLRRRRN